MAESGKCMSAFRILVFLPLEMDKNLNVARDSYFAHVILSTIFFTSRIYMFLLFSVSRNYHIR